MVEEGTCEGEVAGSNLVCCEARDFCTKNATTCDIAGGWLTGGDLLGLKKIFLLFFWLGFDNFLKRICRGGGCQNHCYKSSGAAPTNHM